MPNQQFVDHQGLTISFGNQIGQGGEGAVFEINGDPHRVAKIYHQPTDSEKARKLGLMVRLASPDITKFAAWPLATLHERTGGPTRGLILPRINDAKEVHELYGPKHREIFYPDKDWRFLIRVAKNCAIAFQGLHQKRIVIGDVNQGNVFVTNNGLVRLIDCDSFQIEFGGEIYKCPVGVAHFVPPELQNMRLRDVIRTPNHDNFGLAVLIFHLLCMGRHPFAGRYLGTGDMPIERAIREYRFAYSAKVDKEMSPPPYAITLNELPSKVSSLFEQSFQRGSERPPGRPGPQAWIDALDIMEKQLQKCSDNSGHFYVTHLTSCVWCAIEQKGGPDFFESVMIKTDRAPFDVDGIWREIESIRLVLPPLREHRNPASPPPRRPLDLKGDDVFLQNAVGIIGLSSGLILLFSVFFSKMLTAFSLSVLIIFGVWWLVLRSSSPLRQSLRVRKQAVEKARHQLGSQLQEFQYRREYFKDAFENKKAALSNSRRSFHGLSVQENAELNHLKEQVRQRQLDDYLRRCFIANAKIPNIGPGRIAALESYGIETAFDIDYNRILQVQGFGITLTNELLYWKESQVRRFQFNPSKGVPKTDIERVKRNYAKKRLVLQHTLSNGPKELEKILLEARKSQEQLESDIAVIRSKIEQANADLSSLSTIPWWR